MRLGDAPEVREETDRVAARVARGEVSPAAGLQVDLERTQAPISSPRIKSNPFLTLPPALWKPAADKLRKDISDACWSALKRADSLSGMFMGP